MSEPTLSVIVPAWNEEKYIGRAIDSLRHAARCTRASAAARRKSSSSITTARTAPATVAREHGAQVVFEPVNNIGKARNTGVKAARGKYIAFCDADNQVTENLLVLIHDHLEDPKIAGGGTWIEPERRNFKISFFYFLWGIYVRGSGVGVGMMHCRKADFETFGGFDEIDLCRGGRATRLRSEGDRQTARPEIRIDPEGLDHHLDAQDRPDAAGYDDCEADRI